MNMLAMMSRSIVRNAFIFVGDLKFRCKVTKTPRNRQKIARMHNAQCIMLNAQCTMHNRGSGGDEYEEQKISGLRAD